MAPIPKRKRGDVIEVARYRKRTRKAFIPRAIKFPVPEKMRSVLHYSEQINLTVPVAASTFYTFAANGMFDPNITGVGHQPAGFDQLMLLYNKFCVEKATIQVTFSQESALQYSTLVGILCSSDSPSSTDFRRYTETPMCNYKVIKALQANNEIVKNTFNGNNFFNKSYQADTDKNGTDTSNPAELVYFELFLQPANPGNTAGSTQCQVQIRYEAMFSDPKALIGS